MKKETIFRHELNESIQANAAMNCLKNRNNHKQINEVAPVVAAAGRMLLPMLRPVITKLVQKALVKIGTHARPT
jgi:methionyl-tRNA synthetase